MSAEGEDRIVSPDGSFIWDGKSWIESPPGTIQSFIWDGDSWSSICPVDGGIMYSPDKKKIWTGKTWIPSPPSVRGTISLNKKNPQVNSKDDNNSFGDYKKGMRNLDSKDVAISTILGMFAFFVTISMISSQIIQPLLFDASIVRVGRYAITFDAWDSVEEEQDRMIVGIGSSMLQYAMDGTCIEEEIGADNVGVFNLAIPGSMPYIEMIQTEAAVRASPELIILEVGPNSLWDVDEYSNEALMDYFELRLSILSMDLNTEDEGRWVEILRDSEFMILNNSIENRYKSESLYADEAIEEVLRRLILDKSAAPRKVSAAYVPHPSHDTWLDYLRTQNWLYSKLELMDNETRSSWENNTVVNAVKYGVHNPNSNGTLNHEALEYMVSRFSEEGIKVILVSPPLHPLLLNQLRPNQYLGHNQTLDTLSQYPDVHILNLIWENFWVDDDFYDHNHLDRHGRETFCQHVSPIIKDLLSD